jgi:hypothetical protein
VNAPADQKKSLVQTLVNEVSDVGLVCYLAHSGGQTLLKDLFECIRDAESLSLDDLLYNISIVRQKKIEASKYPMYLVFRSLMNPNRVGAPSLTDSVVSSRRGGFGEPRDYIKGDGLSPVRH